MLEGILSDESTPHEDRVVEAAAELMLEGHEQPGDALMHPRAVARVVRRARRFVLVEGATVRISTGFGLVTVMPDVRISENDVVLGFYSTERGLAGMTTENLQALFELLEKGFVSFGERIDLVRADLARRAK